MASARLNIDNPQQLPPSQQFPTRQLVFFTSGCLAGAATLPVQTQWSRLSSDSREKPLRSHIPKAALAATTVLRAGIRFIFFDVTQTALKDSIPTSNFLSPNSRIALIGGLSGASGGTFEVLLPGLLSLRPRLPAMGALTIQSSKLFLCFGTHTFISDTCSKKYGLPPEPLPIAWAMGATAGGFGTAILAAVEEARGRVLRASALNGALVIGTVISMHVTTCAAMLRRLDG